MRSDGLIAAGAALVVLAGSVAAAADAGAAAMGVAVTVTDASVSATAQWKDGTWTLTRDDLALGLTTSARMPGPVLALEIEHIDSAVDAAGASLLAEDTNYWITTEGRWALTAGEAEQQPDPRALSVGEYPHVLRPTGGATVISAITGIVRVVVAQGQPQAYAIPIDGARRVVPVGDSGFSVEVGRRDFDRPSIAVDPVVIDHLSAMVVTEGGTRRARAGYQTGKPCVFCLAAEPVTGDTATFTLYREVTVQRLAFTLGPIDLSGMLGEGSATGAAAAAMATAVAVPVAAVPATQAAAAGKSDF